MLFFALASSLTAQRDSLAQDPVKDLETFVRKVMKDYEALPITKNKERMMGYFSKDYVMTRYRFSIKNVLEEYKDDYYDLDRLATLVSQTPNMTMVYTIEKFTNIFATSAFGYCIFEASYEITRDGKPYVKGRETVTYYVQKDEQRNWKIIRGHTIQIRDQVNRSACTCQIYKSTAGEDTYLVKVEIPEGDRYTKQIHNFVFSKMKSGMRTIEVDGTLFTWDNDDNIHREQKGLQEAVQVGEQAGKAKKPADAVGVILQYAFYPDNCSSIKFEK
jgi:hypothetical protein